VKSRTKERTIAILLGIGFTAGLLGGLLGIGGGALIVPALVFFLLFDQHRAHGTSLAVVIMLSLVSVAGYYWHGNVDFLFALGLAVGGMIGAIIGGSIVQKIKSRALRRLFSLFLVISGVKMLWDASMGHAAAGTVHIAQFTLTCALIATGAGILTGCLSSLLGVGGGIVMVPVLTVLFRLPQATAQGTSLAAMLPIACTGMLKHRSLGNVDIRVAKWVALGAAIGAIIGATLANILNPSTLKLIFGIFIIVMAVLMAAKK